MHKVKTCYFGKTDFREKHTNSKRAVCKATQSHIDSTAFYCQSTIKELMLSTLTMYGTEERELMFPYFEEASVNAPSPISGCSADPTSMAAQAPES